MRPMPIIRSRTGCFTCRRRKKKCNEEKPICSGCKRNRLDCHWPTDTKPGAPGSSASAAGAVTASGSGASTSASASTAASTGPQSVVSSGVVTGDHPSTTLELPTHQQKPLPRARTQSFEIKTEPTSVPVSTHPQPPFLASSSGVHVHVISSDGSASPVDIRPMSDADMAEADEEIPPPSPSSSSSSGASAGIIDGALSILPGAMHDQGMLNDLAIITKAGIFPDSDPVRLGISLPMSMLPQHGHDSYELLSYYLSRTANSMGNGSTEVNPFIAKLIPLAFSDPLVLQLILAQSAVHRQASEERQPSDIVAQRYYTDSLRMFRNVVGEYVSGKQSNTLVLTVGSLILCLTEVAKGDIHGTIFDHLTASKSLLQSLLARPKSEISDDLPEFLVEYYMHMAASSMISIDPQYSSQPLLSPDIEHLARGLLEKKYVGQLCGCWLELLILIPQIFHLGHSMLLAVNTHTPPTSDDIITFGFLQSQVMGFFPDPSAGPHARLAALVFKQGVLLYLWTILGTPYSIPENSAHKNLIDGAVAEAISLLAQFPATVRINTSLCWPLAVIGCCTSDPAIQNVLRTRLQTMVDTIGLGNMRETLTLLEHVWKQPLSDTSPWTLCRAMREHQIWISFA